LNVQELVGAVKVFVGLVLKRQRRWLGTGGVVRDRYFACGHAAATELKRWVIVIKDGDATKRQLSPRAVVSEATNLIAIVAFEGCERRVQKAVDGGGRFV
jgi:hypothetical protein